ncbi:MAG: dGTP triphosphohydrolase [Peptoanaerobacter stomatis]
MNDIPLKNNDNCIPLKSDALETMCNSNIGEYGYKNELKDNDTNDKNGKEETYRTDLRRQRDKILYTGGFRRLQDKTQVMSATISGDHRTRLTHTLEVEQIAVSIANALKLNVDIVSAIALGHDVGHTPFGHAAERKLNELLRENGGFHHPIQSVRYLWEKYGSKINKEIYEGILLHDSDMFEINKEIVKKQLNYLNKLEGEKEFESWIQTDNWINEFPSTLEAQAVIWSDKIAYITHDLEDFLRSPMFANLQKNDKDIEGKLCKILEDLIVKKKVNDLKDFELRDLIRNITTNLIENSAKNIKNEGDFKQNEVKEKTEKRSKENGNKKKQYLNSLIINFSDEYRKKYYNLREFLDKHYIFSPEVQRSDAKAEVIVEWLFKKLNENYRLMPLSIRYEVDKALIERAQIIYDRQKKEQNNNQKKEQIDLADFEKKLKKNASYKKEYEEIKRKIISRKVAAYISTMSDTYAEDMYGNLIGSKEDFIL